ncbi:endonuclease/exonuclease/phosphatase family protein [Pelagibacterium sp. H642]|uniref:endonuclease/exonuclease/phosphatase family protein n=1 Tax=Pelagibacterium sp. H642 TaxID=1881069 RepID=UPI002815897B|nr:endonuclease/exonuclease/phosphatase family protein [Pelagibacterium sp. H642]WMT90788.1 endonuclease/exonuclease/phosphatase family protein [Pelagibacterium sp. H642]
MRVIGTILAALVAAGYLLACCLLAAMAIAAALGFIYPAMDLFNHIQPVLFFGLAALVLAAPVFVRFRPLRALALSIAATGLVASSIIYVPELVAGFVPRSEDTEAASTYRLMTFNVFGRNEEPQSIVDNIASEDPDFVALQEYSPGVRSVVHPLLTQLYPHFQYCTGGQRAFVGLYSKLPFEPLNEDACSSSIMSQDRTARIIVRVETQAGPAFSLATTHNDWPAPVTRQAEQFAMLRDALSTVQPPLILVGDFNSTPWSYTLRGFVSSAGLTRHTFNVPTFPTLWYYLRDWRPTIPFLPIDHVMTRGDITIHNLRTGHPSGSDHLPIIVEFSVGE